MGAKLLQSCRTLCDPMDRSLPGSSFHGILQARILEWIAVPSSWGSSQPRDQTRVSFVSGIGRHVLSTGAIWEASGMFTSWQALEILSPSSPRAVYKTCSWPFMV